MKITTEPAHREDVEPLYQLEKELILQYEDPTVMDLKQALAWTRTKLEGNWQAGTRILLDGQVIGWYHISQDMDFRYELDSFFLKKEWRNQGIGSALLQKILEECDDAVYLYVFQKNRRAVHLYEKYGFEIKRILSPTRMIMERKVQS
jgi:ribosomal protein S18 acetylase RimI-like enzyme